MRADWQTSSLTSIVTLVASESLAGLRGIRIIGGHVSNLLLRQIQVGDVLRAHATRNMLPLSLIVIHRRDHSGRHVVSHGLAPRRVGQDRLHHIMLRVARRNTQGYRCFLLRVALLRVMVLVRPPISARCVVVRAKEWRRSRSRVSVKHRLVLHRLLPVLMVVNWKRMLSLFFDAHLVLRRPGTPFAALVAELIFVPTATTAVVGRLVHVTVVEVVVVRITFQQTGIGFVIATMEGMMVLRSMAVS